MSLIFQWIQQLPSNYKNILETHKPSVVVDGNGNSYIAYATKSTQDDSLDICVVKLDSNGQSVWCRQQPILETTDNDIDPDICVDYNNDIYVIYSKTDPNTDSINIVIFKMDENGNTIWVKQPSDFNTNKNDCSPSIVVDPLGHIYVTFWSYDQDVTTNQVMIFKLDTTGNFLWSKKLKTNNISGNNHSQSVAVNKQGECYITHLCDEHDNVIVILKINSIGDVVWTQQKTIPDSDSIGFPTITVNDDNCYLVCNTSGQEHNIVILKLDTDGNTIWTKKNPSFNTSTGDNFVSITVDKSNMLYVVYSTYGTVSGQLKTSSDGDIVVLQLDNMGNVVNVLQQPTFNTEYDNVYPNITVDGNGNCIVAYYSVFLGVENNESSQNMVIFKLRSLFCVTGNTNILMSDGTLKKISDINRGDVVAPNHQVAKVCKERIDWASDVSLVVFEKNCLGSFPNEKLIITPNHPIIYKGARRPAKCFANCPNVTVINKVLASKLKEFLSPISLLSGDLYLYDLQFDHDGSFIANGTEIQSRSPYSYMGPLSEDLYFDKSLYSDELVWDSRDQFMPLDETILNFNLVILKNKRHNNVISENNGLNPNICCVKKYT